MKRPSRHLCACLVALALAGAPRPSSAAESHDLSLADAVALALSRNPDVLSAGADVAQSEGLLRSARQLPNPSLSYSTTKIPTDGSPAGTPPGNGFYDRSYDTVISLSQPLEIAGKRKDRRLSGEAALAASRARLRDARRSVGNAVAKAYAAALFARETAAISRESAASLGRSAELAKSRFEAGEISKTDLLQIQIAEGRFRADSLAAEGALRTSLIALAAALGEPREAASLRLTDSLAALAAAAEKEGGAPGPAGTSDPLGARPDVEAAQRSLDRADADRQLQRDLRVPDPTLLVQYEREPPDRPNSAGFGIALALPLFNLNTGAIQAADAARESARIDLDRARSRARAEMAAAASNLATARARFRTLDAELLPKAREVRETVAFAWTEGGASLLELLEAERSLNDLRTAAASAQSDLVQAAADDRAARGLLPGIPGEENR
jgi:cobalt-zinc-cadmium efflux system outer membrane protein